ncbi:MAG: xanthine dehydrogenase family protein subunit M [Caldiserica bacterium]|nr:MAG: xanthine dehydrogenase family protein subunit M [Caldisericota bacterium]
MAIVHEFEYFKPERIEDVIKLLSEYKGKARLLAGGTDLVVRIKDELESPAAVIDIKGIEELKKLEFREGKLHIGALVTFTDLIDSDIVKKQFPLFWESSKTIASPGIRNRATLAGNICSGVPSLDSGPALLVYEADIIVRGAEGERVIPALNWFLGPRRTALKEEEFVREIVFSLPAKNHGGSYIKLGRYKGEDLAQVGLGILALEGNEYRLAFCAVGPVPSRAKKIEALLNGKPLTDSLLETAKRLVSEEISPITDVRATKEYRVHVAKIMLERGIRAAVERIDGNGPAYGERLI